MKTQTHKCHGKKIRGGPNLDLSISKEGDKSWALEVACRESHNDFSNCNLTEVGRYSQPIAFCPWCGVSVDEMIIFDLMDVTTWRDQDKDMASTIRIPREWCIYNACSTRCDVINSPCACGATHKWEEIQKKIDEHENKGLMGTRTVYMPDGKW